MRVAIVHDYLTQRGGAERVVLGLLQAFPGAPVYTSAYNPARTFREFAGHDVRVSPLDRIGLIRRDHRLGLPLYAPAFSRLLVDADVVVCSSSGWSHGVRVTGRKIVYCHNPARWLYQSDQYLRESSVVVRAALGPMAPFLRRWDRRAAASADLFLANSTVVAQRILATYGIEAEVVPPPPAILSAGERSPVAGLTPGYFLTVGRLQAYKNTDVLVEAFRQRPDDRLVVVGDGPLRGWLAQLAGPNVTFLRAVPDAQLRWLYANAAAVVAASHEDYGLTPLEAAAFGRPVAVLRWGGFLDTVVEDRTGVFFDQVTPASVLGALDRVSARTWDECVIAEHLELFSAERFAGRMQGIVHRALAAA